MVVGLHHITWRATASGVADETVVADAIAWLVGDPELVEIEPTTSYHGSKLHMVTGVCKKKAHSLKSLSRIGTECLQTLLEEVDVVLMKTTLCISVSISMHSLTVRSF